MGVVSDHADVEANDVDTSAAQHANSGELVIVATPIGNLGDLSARARDALADADVVCCEDTRRTRVLLSASGIPAGRRLVSLHAHNESSKGEWVVTRVAAGARIAYVTDAGTPGVSDPGARLIAAVVAAGLRVTVVPGPSAALAALVVSGLATDRFCVDGFLPRRGGERDARVAALDTEERTTVLFESPARLAVTLAELAAALGPRNAAVCRELTKRHEEVRRGTLTELAAQYAGATAPKGEIVIVVAGAPARVVDEHDVVAAVKARLDAGSTTRDAAASVAASLGVSRRRAYEIALRLQP
jgi:16S rRNA (cytidine1402-2'-O)-methyltransferase